jgi:hypothetical protein
MSNRDKRIAEKEARLKTPTPEALAFLQAVEAQDAASANIEYAVAKYKGMRNIIRGYMNLQPKYMEPLKSELLAAIKRGAQTGLYFQHGNHPNPEYVLDEVLEMGKLIEPLKNDPDLKAAKNEVAALQKQEANLAAIPHLIIRANQRTNTRKIPKGSVNAVRGTPISYNRPMLDFEGEYGAGRYYQNSAKNILASRKHPRTQEWLTNVTWFTPAKGGWRR